MSNPIKEFADLAVRFRASGTPTELWWLSFCDGDRPEGSRFLGVCIMEALNPSCVDERVAMADAIRASHMYGCNPGGEIQAFSLPGALGVVDGKWLNRLLTKAECEAFDLEYAPKADA